MNKSTERYVTFKQFHEGGNLEPFLKELPVKERDLAIPDKNSVISQYTSNFYVQYNINGSKKQESVFLPIITKEGFSSTKGKYITGGSTGDVYYVQHQSVAEKTRVYKIVDFLSVCTGEDLQAQKIASDCGVSPHFYGAALLKVTNENYSRMKERYHMIWELDFIEDMGKQGSDYNKKVLEKVQMLCQRCVLQKDLKDDNILIDKENRLFIIDYDIAHMFSNTNDCIKYAWSVGTSETYLLKKVVIEVLETQYKQKIEDVEKKQLVGRFFCWPPLKENLIHWFSRLCADDAKELENKFEFDLLDLKQKYLPQEQEALTLLLKQWLTE